MVATVVAVAAIAVLAVPTGGASIALAGFLGVSTAVASALITVGLTLAVSFAFKALGITSQAPSTKVQATPVIIRQSLTDSYIIYGRRRVIFLKMVFYHGKKVGSQHTRYFVFAVAGHRCAGNPTWMLNDEAVTVDGSGLVTSGKYAGAIHLWFQRGLDSETANATFVSECGGKWTANHKGNNVAAIYMKAVMSDEIVEAGFATPSPVIDGKDDIYDPRDESTGFTSNAALVAYDWLALARDEGGFGAWPDEIPDEDWISAQANVCDEEVESEPRYALNGIITTGAAPSEIRDAMILNMAGTYTFSGGKHLIRPGYWVPVSVTLEEDDLAGPIQVVAFGSQGTAADQVLATFIDPDNNYQPMPAPAVTISPAPDDASQLDLDLGFTTSAHQAYRIATIMFNRAQCDITVVWPANIMGLTAKALDTVQFNTTRYSLSNYAFSVGGWQFDATFGVTINGREENEDIYADPDPVTPDSVPAISQGEVVTLTSAESTLIANSSTMPTSIATATDEEITIIDHARRYLDKEESVTGTTLTEDADSDPLVSGQAYGLYYDDEEREGGAVDWFAVKASTNAADAYTSPDNPYRHFGGFITMDSPGGTGTSGGGSYPPGSAPGGEILAVAP